MNWNFEAYLCEEGNRVPGSTRKGHNVFTDWGKYWLRQLITWDFDGADPDNDDPFADSRVRWLGVGSGSQIAIPGVSTLVTPELVTGSQYLAELSPASTTNPVVTSVKFEHTFGTGDLPDPVDVTEAGLYVGKFVSPNWEVLQAPSPETAFVEHVGDPREIDDMPPVAYKTFDSLTKNSTNSLVIKWELRF